MVLPLQNARNRSAQSGPFSGRKLTVTVTPTPATPANSTVVVAVPFPGARPGDIPEVSFGASLIAGFIFAGTSVVAADSINLRFANITAAPVTQPAVTVNILNRSGI